MKLKNLYVGYIKMVMIEERNKKLTEYFYIHNDFCVYDNNRKTRGEVGEPIEFAEHMIDFFDETYQDKYFKVVYVEYNLDKEKMAICI